MTTLIVGLGNLGKKYENTRHNVGFMLVDQLATKMGLKWADAANYYYAKKKEFVLLKPRTMMNLSGVAVKDGIKRFVATRVLVIFDDVNLQFTSIRIRKSGSAGGHNGVKSIIQCLSSDEFERLRIGVGGGEHQSLIGHVLGNFSKEQTAILPRVINFSQELVEIYLEQDADKMLEHFSKNKKTYSESVAQDRK